MYYIHRYCRIADWAHLMANQRPKAADVLEPTDGVRTWRAGIMQNVCKKLKDL